jgi:hypothetical protein
VRGIILLLVGIIGLSWLESCSTGQDLPVVNAAIGQFHERLNSSEFDVIYAQSSLELRHMSGQPEFTQLLLAVHRKLGNFQSGSTANWNDNLGSNGHFVTLNFAAKYERGSANESFVYKVNGNSASLAGYHVSSNALLLN